MLRYGAMSKTMRCFTYALDRAERLQIALARKGLPMTISNVLRLAMDQGLKGLERAHKTARAGRKR
jgi:hypothetical protein